MHPQRPRRWSPLSLVLLIAGIVLVLGLSAFFLFDHYVRQQYEPLIAKFRKDVTDQAGFFCEQQAILASDPWFHEPRTGGDAGPLLNAWLSWEPLLDKRPANSPLKIPQGLPSNNLDFKEWLTSKVDVSSLDFGWMRRLQAYDHWDLLKNSPIPPTPRYDLTTAPMPNFVDLILWTKFRLLHGLRTGQPLEAGRDVRHLAWLAYRSDTMIGGMVATALLSLERQAHDSLPSPPLEWQPLSGEQVSRMRALLRTGYAFSNLATPVEVGRRARQCGELTMSRCGALTEAAFMVKYLRPLAQEQYPEVYAAFDEELAGPICPTSLIRTVWERGTTVLDPPQKGSLLDSAPWLTRLPEALTRRHLMGILLSLALPRLQPLEDFRKDLESGQFKPAEKP